MRTTSIALALLLFSSTAVLGVPDAWEKHREMEKTSPFRGLPWRCIGPIVQGGRVVDIEVVPGEPYTFYVAYASGGLWKTENNGVTFEPLFDDQPTMIMGDVAVAPSAPSTVWVGTGESNSSRSSYGGVGLFRSDDAGKTWRQAGLEGTDRIGRILIDPRDPNRVLVAALGKLYTPGGDRGIYLSDDGGESWRRVQAGENEWTGFVDLVRDPSNPDVIYAAAWERKRRPWNFVEGGAGSGVYKSEDNGESWTRLGGGFPRGEHVGRIGLAVAPSRPGTVYAVVDDQTMLPEELWDLGDGAVTPKRLRGMSREEFLAQDPEEIEDFLRENDLDPALTAEKLLKQVREGEVTIQDLIDAVEDANRNLFETDIQGPHVFRSDDGGRSWTATHDEPIRETAYTYGYYFGQIRVAPDDPETVYILGVPLLVSEDGGRSWRNVNERNVHVDHHELWIDPAGPRRLLSGNDGGLNMSFDGGLSWLKLNAIPVGQFYTVAVDMADPYNVYGGLQDNGVLRGSSKARIYQGRRPGISQPWEFIGGGDGMYVNVDPRDDATTYLGYQFGYYYRLDPDGKRSPVRPRNAIKEPALRYNWATPVRLSTHNPDVVYFGANRLYRSMDKGESWAAISPDLTTSTERGDVPFATITTLSESPRTFGLIWAGTDDGHVWVTRDGGVDWNEVSAGLPADRWVSRVESSHHDSQVAYVALNGYRDDDDRVYLYRTPDLGKTWQDLSAGLPAEPVNVAREDPVNEKVLYAGTDLGVYVSLDRGVSWHALQAGLPDVPVHDLVVHPRERELVAGTHGRSVWIVDVLPIQELTPTLMEERVYVFPIQALQFDRDWRSRRPRWWHRPEDDPYLDVPFWSRDGGPVELSITDDVGDHVLRRETLETTPGVNVFRWDLLLDAELAVAAEREMVAAEERTKRANVPWSEAVRLERPVYVTPGKYAIQAQIPGADEMGWSQTKIEVEEPEPREPRVEPKPKIRAEKDDDEDGGD